MSVHDPDEANTNEIDPLVPRAIDLPTTLPAGGVIDPAVGDIAKIFAAPQNPADWPAWRADLAAWRLEARSRLEYSGAAYEFEHARWTRAAYSVALTWLWDERLFDHENQRFTVDAFLESTADLGGFDGIVLWHAYPIIGIDDRNQFDFYRDVPGIVELVAAFHDRGLKVFIDYNPWDTGTRRAAHNDAGELAIIVGELGVDGVFLDTMKEGDAALIRALQWASPPQVLEGESRVPNQRIEDHHLSWAQWFADSDAPGVMRAHWYERRHMMHSTRRWNHDHSAELQSAWMNGTGILVWDTVFGVWVGWNPRDRSTLRRALRVQRAANELFVEGEWTPLSDALPEALAAGVYVSRWESDELTLFTIVNRGTDDYTGPVIGGVDGELFDVTSGARLDEPRTVVPARGIAGILAVRGQQPVWLDPLLAAASADERSTDDSFPARPNVRLAAPTSRLPAATASSVVVEPGQYDLPLTYRRRETGVYQGAPYVEEWKPLAPRLHDDRSETVAVTVGRVAVAATEVTAAEFAAYKGSTDGSSAPVVSVPATSGPATSVTLADARAYAESVGARVPTEFEWQLAAARPGFERGEPRVWNWTESEHSDGITRFVMLKGGSDHESLGSDWYVDGGVRPPEFSLKYLLAGLGVEASTSIGFRLAWDLS